MAAFDPSLVDGDGCAVVADAGGDVALAGSSSNEEADEAKTIGGDSIFAEAATVVCVVVEGPRCKSDEQQRDDDLVLRFGFDLTFGVERQFLPCG